MVAEPSGRIAKRVNLGLGAAIAAYAAQRRQCPNARSAPGRQITLVPELYGSLWKTGIDHS